MQTKPKHATCCGACFAQRLEAPCFTCEAPQLDEPQTTYVLFLHGSPRGTITTSKRMLEIVLLGMTRGGDDWRAQPKDRP